MIDPDDDDLPLSFVKEEDPPIPKREAADHLTDDDEDFSSLEVGETPFTSIEDSADFAGLEGDLDRHSPPAQKQGSHVNEYGVKVRSGKRNQPLADDDEIQFSVNLGDN